MTEQTAEEKIARYEFVLDAYVRELTKLREENARLREGAHALATLQNIYRNCDLPESLRTKAAPAALAHEVPRLMPVEAPLDLVAEPIIPLAELVEQRRARQDALEPPHKVVDGQVLLLKGNGRNDGD